MDDVLSAVDAHVGKYIFFECILNSLRGRKKAVVLATHQVQYLQYADRVLVLDGEGNQTFFGPYQDLVDQKEKFEYIGLSSVSRDKHFEAREAEVNDVDIGGSRNGNSADEEHAGQRHVADDEVADANAERSPESSTKPTPPPPSISANSTKNQLQGVQMEKSKVGKISFNLWTDYIANGGIWRGLYALLSALLSQGSLMMADYWLKCELVSVSAGLLS